MAAGIAVSSSPRKLPTRAIGRVVQLALAKIKCHARKRCQVSSADRRNLGQDTNNFELCSDTWAASWPAFSFGQGVDGVATP